MRGGASLFRSATVLLLLAGVVVFGGCDQLLNLANEDPGTINGVIRNSVDNNIVTVLVNVTTDDGTYRLEDVNPGTRTVRFTASGFDEYSRTINVSSGETVPLDAYLVPQKGTIQGSIRDSQSNELIMAEVQISVDGASPVITTNGYYTINNVDFGTRQLVFTSNGYQQHDESVYVSSGQTVTLNVQMEQSG